MKAIYAWTMLALSAGTLLIATAHAKNKQSPVSASLATISGVTPSEGNRLEPGSLTAKTGDAAADTSYNFGSRRWQLKGGLPPLHVGREFFSGDTVVLAGVGHGFQNPGASGCALDGSDPSFPTPGAA